MYRKNNSKYLIVGVFNRGERGFTAYSRGSSLHFTKLGTRICHLGSSNERGMFSYLSVITSISCFLLLVLDFLDILSICPLICIHLISLWPLSCQARALVCCQPLGIYNLCCFRVSISDIFFLICRRHVCAGYVRWKWSSKGNSPSAWILLWKEELKEKR